ncbi:cytochrome b/b6 domain-containing protein [Tropicibacter oceani]|uniref:Cytochrome b/b6 domain-containing protein n=1 Tax=Tropicibacter oceani TaxID=3058420 RepID=A0ABY8QCW7_9RHOB|nr:cytochrome b/b6 domain-containing protein [Tropicibacter oceani]WGW02474.1 cytochrome b/b6 domain-containing protein [Tropicibacter oceani]
MPLTNTATRFGSAAKALHWATALGILSMIPLGIIASDAPYDTADQLAWKAQLFSVHKTVGVGLFFLALVRIAWALSQPRPAPLHPDRKLETWTAETVHWLLYGSLVIVPLSGWLHHAATTGFAPILWPFGQGLPFVPSDPALAELFGALHRIFEKVLVVSVLLHVAGAIKHHVIDRDATLRRMLPGRTEAGSKGRHGSAMASLGGAVLIWAAALGIGAAQGAFSHPEAPATPALAQVDSDWVVQDGTLSITIQQFGKQVTGQFADWQAAIRFDGPDAPAPQGTVTVDVAIGSLTLGSVTDQAMGPDFFDAKAHPTARFTGDIHALSEQYEAQGTLTLRGTEVPLTLSFQLDIDGDTAQATGFGTLDRRAFGIGAAMSDAGQLGFDVRIDFALTALRGAP